MSWTKITIKRDFNELFKIFQMNEIGPIEHRLCVFRTWIWEIIFLFFAILTFFIFIQCNRVPESLYVFVSIVRATNSIQFYVRYMFHESSFNILLNKNLKTHSTFAWWKITNNDRLKLAMFFRFIEKQLPRCRNVIHTFCRWKEHSLLFFRRQKSSFFHRKPRNALR